MCKNGIFLAEKKIILQHQEWLRFHKYSVHLYCFINGTKIVKESRNQYAMQIVSKAYSDGTIVIGETV